jgi:hypothetical protein
MIVTPESVTLELPVFFNITGNVFERPRFSFPKLRLVGVAAIVRVSATPVPLTVIVSVLFVALLTIDTLPATYPVTVGSKVSVAFAVLPPVSTRGVVIPCSAKPFPATLTVEIVTVRAPTFVNWTVCEFVVPSGTLPKPALGGVARNAGATPVPVIARLTELFDALLVSARYPANDPDVSGANFSVTVTDFAGWIVVGTLSPLTLNALPDTVSLVIVSAARPSFQMVMESVLLPPSFSLPKLAEVGLNTINPCAATRLAVIPPVSSVTNTINNRAKRPATSLNFSWSFVFGPWFLIAPTA